MQHKTAGGDKWSVAYLDTYITTHSDYLADLRLSKFSYLLTCRFHWTGWYEVNIL